MTTGYATHRLEGLEPDNLLAFMALLGLLRVLEEARSEWNSRVFWTINEPPLRPVLRVPETVQQDAVVEAVAEGLADLSALHDFDKLLDLTLPPKEAVRKLRKIASRADEERYTADLWAALISDAAIARDGKKVEPTPLCLMFGQGHQHFLSRLDSVPKQRVPPQRGSGRKKIDVSEAECLHEALFATWTRPDATDSFRWDPNEDVRYALRARDPTDTATKETTQHGANRLAAIGFSQFTVVPRLRANEVHLALLGHNPRQSDRSLTWPIWCEPASLASIRALLVHPHLNDPEARRIFGVAELRTARRISVGKFMNFMRAEPDINP